MYLLVIASFAFYKNNFRDNSITKSKLQLLVYDKMNIKLYIIYTAAVLSLICPAFAGSTATIHGAVYKCGTFEPLDNAVIEVNSTPTQYMVAKNGQYSVELVPGNYTITAKYYQNSILTYSTEETIGIQDDKDGEDYVLDLLLLPVDSEGFIDDSKISMVSENLSSSAKNSFQGVKSPITREAIAGKNNPNGSNNTQKPLESTTENFEQKSGIQTLSRTANMLNLSNLINNLVTYPTQQSRLYSPTEYYLLASLKSLLLLLGGYQIFKKRASMENNTFQKGKNEYIMSSTFLGLLNTPELLVKVLTKGAQNREGYPVQDKEIVESGPEEENSKISLEEPVYDSIVENPSFKKKPLLPADLREVIDIIRSQGGQISQKDLRSRLKYSEVKVSLMLADLEKRKRIKKLKRGRENIVFLMDNRHEN